tara:strand:+ start:875 stop:3082 length:2208 start_codon:yes stop_codon:yes gene_type:complete
VADLKVKRAPQTESDQRAWETVYDDINDIINSVNQKSSVESRDGALGNDGDIRLFKDIDSTKYFIEGKFTDGWAKRELLFSDSSEAGQDESINFSSTESYIKPDGTVDFTAQIKGISPAGGNAAHLATKGYVDANATAFELTGNVTGGTSGATAVVTTIADNTISQAKMLNNSVGTNEILDDNVTYAKIQNVSATNRILGRDSSGAGVIEEIDPSALANIVAQASSASNDPSLFLSGTGNFREPSFTANVSALSDTQIQSLANGHFLRYNYVSEGHANNKWKNALLLESDIPDLSTSKVNSGTFDNARISQGSVTQHTAAIKSTGSLMSNFNLFPDIAVNDAKIIKIVTQQGSYGTGSVETSGNTHTVTLNALNTDTNTNQLTTFTLTGDNGANATIGHGNTLDVEGGTGVTTAVGSPDKVTVSIGQNIGTSNSPTFAGLTLSSLSSQSSEATAVMINGSNVIGKRELGSAAFANTGDFKGATAVVSVATGGTGQDNVTAFKNVLDDETWTFANTGDFKGATAVVSVATGGTGQDNVTAFKNVLDDETWTFANTVIVNGARMDVLGDNDRRITFGDVGTPGANSSHNIRGRSDGLYFNAPVTHVFEVNGGAEFTLNGSAALFAGTIRGSADVVAYYSSDPILKENKKLIENSLDKISQLGGYSFDWKEEAKDMVGDHLSGKDYGVMADEVQALFPELVNVRSNGIRAVKYDKLVPLLIEGIKELKKELNAIKEQL